MMSQPTCETCRFLHKLDPSDQRSPAKYQCRRYPAFEEAYLEEWCGEHKPKTPIVTENLT